MSGGNFFAVVNLSKTAYEPPHMATFPSQNGCFASHSTTSCPSRGSFVNGSNSPPEFPRPRTSTSANTYPCDAKYAPRSWYVSDMYGVSVKITGVFGREPSGVFGKYNVPFSSTPSRIGILTPQRRL